MTAVSFLGGAVFAGAFGHRDGLFGTRGRFAFHSPFSRTREFLVGVLVAVVESVGRRLARRAAAAGA